MPISKEKKTEIIEDLKEKLSKQKSIVFVGIKGLKTKDIEDLKRELKQEECTFLVTKKTLLNIVLKEMKFEPVTFETSFALALGFKDEVAPARIVYKKSKKEGNISILGGILENQIRPEEEMIALGNLPSREILLQQLVGTIASPIQGFLNVLQGNIKGLVYVLNAIKK